VARDVGDAIEGPDTGVMITYNDITERRRAELEAQKSRQDIARVTRVATMGEMAVSLAHQLNQPLTALMTNSRAADKLLVDGELDVAEFRAILSDVAEDVRRASEVIQRLRELLKKESAPHGAVDLNAAIRAVATLLHSDAVIRNVTVSVNLDASPLLVRGDRVQLQQAVLNLMVNALDAIGERPENHRRVVVASRRGSADIASVTVQDSGDGLASGHEELVFEPCYTTKPNGMEMGLPIVRSIVESHGGTVRARSHEGPRANVCLCRRVPQPPER
jgi:two-component system, LuxR family, sensor kinase FixL